MPSQFPSLHFAHGNGFPASCYRQFLVPLESHYACYYLDKLGHNEQFPIEDNWYPLVQELKSSVIQHPNGTPVIAVGHSLGGVLSVLAALESPQLFKGIVLLDSPLLGRLRSHGLKLAKRLGWIDKVTPAHRTRGRRRHWKTHQDAVHYLKSRPLFSQFTAQCLDDYIQYGMHKDSNGYHLKFDVEIEYQIYKTIPHTLSQFNLDLKVPTTLLYGADSDVVHMMDRKYMNRRFGIEMIEVPGTHMFPFEHPNHTAQAVLKAIELF